MQIIIERMDNDSSSNKKDDNNDNKYNSKLKQ